VGRRRFRARRALLATLENQTRVEADPGGIEQVVVNLTANARDAMPNGGRLTIESAIVDVDPRHAERQTDARVAVLPV